MIQSVRNTIMLALIAFGCSSCASTAPAAKSPECSVEQLGKIEAAFVADAVEACQGKTTETCEALPAIREKYAAKRTAWESCK